LTLSTVYDYYAFKIFRVQHCCEWAVEVKNLHSPNPRVPHIHTVYKCFLCGFFVASELAAKAVMGRQGGNPLNCQIFATEESRAHIDMQPYPGVPE
jgi:hypothetical protein